MIPIDVLQSVYHIQNGNGSASSFTIECDEKQYLITARHLFYSNEYLEKYSYLGPICDITRGRLKIYQNNKWKVITGNVYFHENIYVDIAVIELIKTKLPFSSLTIDNGSLSFGEDVYFMGYPLGLRTWLRYSTSPYPLPLVKKAIIAGFSTLENGDSVLYLDTQSNPGFSGGPIVIKHPGTTVFKICGIMTAGSFSRIESQSSRFSISYTEDNGLTVVTHVSHLEEIICRLQKRSN